MQLVRHELGHIYNRVAAVGLCRLLVWNQRGGSTVIGRPALTGYTARSPNPGMILLQTGSSIDCPTMKGRLTRKPSAKHVHVVQYREFP